MRGSFRFLIAAGLLVSALPAIAGPRPHRHSSTHTMISHSAASSRMHHSEHFASDRPAGYGISSERATAIQTALIQHGYLTGEPTGSWDASSAAAMQKLQSDNGWQTKLVPDSRALIKLGLGPNSNTAEAVPAASATAQVY